MVRGAGDAMKLALQRKQSKKLVDQKDAVLALVTRASELKPSTVAESVASLHEIESVADELGLPLTGDEWGERLLIKKKGGGVHFEDDVRAQAAKAFTSLGVLHTAVTWHEQLGSRGVQIVSAVGAFRAKGGSGASMSKTKMLEKCTEHLNAVSKTIHDIFSDGSFKATLAELSRLGLPQGLDADADVLRKQALLLAEFAHELAHAEISGLRKESKVTQRFRAPQTLAVLTSADQLMRAVDAAARPAAHVEPERLASLAAAIEEVQPMAGSAQGVEDDELDDEI